MAPASETAAALLRNAHQSLPDGGLGHKLEVADREGRPLRVKLGLDPTAPDIHLGHTVVLQKLREFQDLGHRVVLIVGDYTARVGDPSGRSSTRPVLSGEEIDANAETYRQQSFTVLRDDPDLLEVRRNGEWLDMPAEDLFRLARVATVAQILERDDFAKRFAARQPISVLETLYPLLQGYDSVAIESDVELGGTDQTFNLLLGRDVQRAYGQPEQVILTMPILPGVDGAEKMSKSLGNHVGVAEPPDEQFGKTMRLPDDAMESWFSLLAVPRPPEGTGPRDAKRALARGIVARFHGDDAAAAAEQHFDRLFVTHEAPEEVAEHGFAPENGAVHLPALIAEAFGRSRSEARRLLAQGGVKLDGEALGEGDLDVAPERLDGHVLQLGKRHFRRLRLTS
ncbi:MAG TPA: tyrosine--tRNA ligase [Baekduia sp.]|uniref:tyrosine--tRNA ligase n=1 Tax=Baekduia sp. TaxID=2600305 RepID=UPI002BC2693C|nr:tyrosine--tRNA ligase [Baekduia sp.]HMJ34831.1 tyrosine--tRNA ligase [Baekduia sp.]